jgi:hypothetical protein
VVILIKSQAIGFVIDDHCLFKLIGHVLSPSVLLLETL